MVWHRGEAHRVHRVEPCSTEAGRAAFPTPARWLLIAVGRTEFRLLRTDRAGG